MLSRELALKLLQSGVMTPEQTVELMVFEGKDQLLKQMKEQREQAATQAKEQAQPQEAEENEFRRNV